MSAQLSGSPLPASAPHNLLLVLLPKTWASARPHPFSATHAHCSRNALPAFLHHQIYYFNSILRPRHEPTTALFLPTQEKSFFDAVFLATTHPTVLRQNSKQWSTYTSACSLPFPSSIHFNLALPPSFLYCNCSWKITSGLPTAKSKSSKPLTRSVCSLWHSRSPRLSQCVLFTWLQTPYTLRTNFGYVNCTSKPECLIFSPVGTTCFFPSSGDTTSFSSAESLQSSMTRPSDFASDPKVNRVCSTFQMYSESKHFSGIACLLPSVDCLISTRLPPWFPFSPLRTPPIYSQGLLHPESKYLSHSCLSFSLLHFSLTSFHRLDSLGVSRMYGMLLPLAFVLSLSSAK